MYKKRLNEVRINNNISQKELASIMAISPYSYSHFETEDTIIPIKRLIFLCDYFNVSIDYLFELTNKDNYVNAIKGINQDKNIQRLKNFRKENNLTQTKLAEYLNIGNGTIANYERGSNIIATSFLYQICKKYKISADYLLGKVDEPKYLN